MTESATSVLSYLLTSALGDAYINRIRVLFCNKFIKLNKQL